jgi:hypothetical protein
MHITTSISRRVNILRMKFKIRTRVLYNNGDYPVICEGRHVTHGRIISLKREVWVHTTRLIPLPFIELKAKRVNGICICSGDRYYPFLRLYDYTSELF